MNDAIILAGGTGTRLGADIPKQYIEINQKPIFCFCMETLTKHELVDGVWIVADSQWHLYIEEKLLQYHLLDKWKGFSKPGQNRQLSIWHALQDMRKSVKDEDCVIIHDAARPLLSEKQITDSLKAMQGYDGVLPVLPMKDTIYLSKDGKQVTTLLNRSELFAGQAPEVFRFGTYYEANERLLLDEMLQINGSTEPAILAGLQIALIDGDENNFKITTKEDLERFKERRKRG